MLIAYESVEKGLAPLGGQRSLAEALWVDLLHPTPDEAARVVALGVDVPSLAEMEEIEISNRLYSEGDIHYMTVMLPGQGHDGAQISAPVCLLLMPERLITVRHHAPRPFETFPDRANQTSIGCSSSTSLFLGLIQEVIGRLADILEGVGRGLDDVTRQVYQPDPRLQGPRALQTALVSLGAEGERLSRVRLGLMTLGRALNYYGQTRKLTKGHATQTAFQQGLLHDLVALEVHADFLSSRLALASDATLGMINLAQNATVRIVSVVAVLFLPPTLIASIYGMNFAHMPELTHPLGYPLALGAILGSGVLTWAFFHWRRWL